MKGLLYSILFLTILGYSCKKNDVVEYDSTKKSNVTIEYDNVVGSSDLLLNTSTYTNAVGEAFKITKLKYFVSNFVLTNASGTTYTVPQNDCYFIVDESVASSRTVSLSVPEGEYKTLSFVIGVDSLRNTKDVSQRTGTLDVTTSAADMYWSWNSGYIFFKMEGTADVSTNATKIFQFHIGLFGGMSTPTLNNIKTISIDLTTAGTAKVKTGKTPNIHLMADVLKVFNGSPNVSIATNSTVMVTPFSTTIANNYKNMFSHNHTEN